MDYISIGDKYWVVLSELDCLKLSVLGYECFDLFFTEEDWNHICELPFGGTNFVHFDPTACHFLEYALASDFPDSTIYTTLCTLHNNYEQRMMDCDWPFPSEWESDIFSE